MKASQLIGVLLALMSEHGDMEVRVLRRRDGDRDYDEISDYEGVARGSWEETRGHFHDDTLKMVKVEGFVINDD